MSMSKWRIHLDIRTLIQCNSVLSGSSIGLTMCNCVFVCQSFYVTIYCTISWTFYSNVGYITAIPDFFILVTVGISYLKQLSQFRNIDFKTA